MPIERDEEKSPWEDFQPVREEPRRTGILERLAILAFFCAAGALAGGVFAYLLPALLRGRRHRYDPMALDRALEAHAASAGLRSAVGAAAGAIIAAVWVLRLWRSAKKR